MAKSRIIRLGPWVRCEAPISDELLAPRCYWSVSGERIEVSRTVGDIRREMAVAASYAYDGTRLDNLEPKIKDGLGTFTKEHTELNGATHVLARAGFANVSFRPLPPPRPDLEVVADGTRVYVEVTQLRPSEEAAFQRGIQEIVAQANEAVAQETFLIDRIANQQISLAFIAVPSRPHRADLVEELLRQLLRCDFGPGYHSFDDNILSRYIHSYLVLLCHKAGAKKSDAYADRDCKHVGQRLSVGASAAIRAARRDAIDSSTCRSTRTGSPPRSEIVG